jgi:hypothetical protein
MPRQPARLIPTLSDATLRRFNANQRGRVSTVDTAEGGDSHGVPRLVGLDTTART